MTEIIDKQDWPRRGHYDFFAPMSDPFYTLTFPVDVTALRTWCRTRKIAFYPAMIYAVIHAMNKVEAFHYKDRDGVIVRHDRLVPSFTDLKPGSELFHIVTLETGDNMEEFCRRAKAVSAAQTEFLTQGLWAEDELVYFTCLPWFPITALKNEKNLNPGDSVPRVAWGRWEEKNGKTLLNLSLELNHRLLDGVHVGAFYQALNDWIQKL